MESQEPLRQLRLGKLVCPHNGERYYKANLYDKEVLADVISLLPQLATSFEEAILSSVIQVINNTSEFGPTYLDIWEENLAKSLLPKFLLDNPNHQIEIDTITTPIEIFQSITRQLRNEANLCINKAWSASLTEFGMFSLNGVAWGRVMQEIESIDSLLDADNISQILAENFTSLFRTIHTPHVRPTNDPIIVRCIGIGLGAPTLASLTFNTLLARQGFKQRIGLIDSNEQNNIRKVPSFKNIYSTLVKN